MTKTIETVVYNYTYENAEGKMSTCEHTCEVVTETGKFYPIVVSVNLLKTVEDGIVEDTPAFARRFYERSKAETISIERGIVAKHFDIDPSDID